MDGSDAFQAALTGDLQSAHAALAAATPEWRLPLQASLALVDSQFAMPTPTEVEAVALANPSPAVGLACALGEHACFLAFDRAGLADWLALHRRVVDGDPWLTVGEVLLGVFDGDNDRAQAQLAAAEAIPPSVAHAASRIELVALRGLLALELGDGDAALRFARRAVRMARTEEFPQQQYLAGMVLARVRRYAHQQHLAVRILAALERVAPERWRPWIGWELTLAGSSEDRAVSFADARLSPAVSHLKTALRAASHGERAPWDAAMNHALAAAPAVWIRRELEVLRLLIDPELESAEPWVAGRGPLPPRGLLPVGTHPEEPDAAVMAFVSVHNDGRARRILGVGVALAAGPQLSSSRPGRLETAISVLALAGDVGIGLREFFHEVYHFDYEAGLHKGPLEVLIHRLRELLAGSATLERTRERLFLRPSHDFVTPDPRCAKSIDDRILRTLAESGMSNARATAEKLGAPLRSVQHALKRLVDEGACFVEKQGRAVHYRIEDTTFFEPTRERLRYAAVDPRHPS